MVLRLIFTVTIAATGSWSLHKVPEGGSLTLPCRYSVRRYGLSSVCWGRGCGALWCSGIIVQTDGSRVVSKTADRYRLASDLQAGLVDLTISNASGIDSGPYCCRVDVDGYFNDIKLAYTLQVYKAVAALFTTTSAFSTELHTPNDSISSTESLVLADPDAPNSSSSPSEAGTVVSMPVSTCFTVPCSSTPVQLQNEETLARLSSEDQAPVLSVCLSLFLLLLGGSLAFLTFKRQIHKDCLERGSFRTAEPRHIIQEIQSRRPVEENIYTLD